MQGPQKICPRCGTHAAMNAAACVQCGRQFRSTNPNRHQPQQSAHPTYQRPLTAPLPEPAFHQDVGGWLARRKITSRLAFAAVMFLVITRPGCKPGAPGPNGDKIAAIVTAKHAVEMSLKAPATARFHHELAESTNDGRWVVTGQVDAQNSFGALLRKSYVCTLQYNQQDDTYGIESLTID